jgi:hypothetical protein
MDRLSQFLRERPSRSRILEELTTNKSHIAAFLLKVTFRYRASGDASKATDEK